MTDTFAVRDMPCPRCGKGVESFSVDRPADGFSITEMKRVLAPTEMWVNPCGHPISGYTATNDGVVTELKP